MLRRDLPGFYWDEARQRYFPISSRPPPSTHSRTSKSEGSQDKAIALARDVEIGVSAQKRRTNRSLAYAQTNTLRSANLSFAQAQSIRRRQHANSIASSCAEGASLTCGSSLVSGFDNFSAFKLANMQETQCIFAGDNQGRFIWGYRDRSVADSPFERNVYLPIGKEIRHVEVSGTRTIAIGIDATCAIFVMDMASAFDEPATFMLRCKNPKLVDTYSASFRDKTVVLGNRNRFTVVDDINHQREEPRSFNCGSDVMSVRQHGNNNVLAGCRNGAVKLFDIRDSRARGTNLLDDRFYRKGNRLISSINVVRDWELLISTSSGDLEMFDLRYSSSTKPITAYAGHIGGVTKILGLDVDPSNEFLFAAGQDRTVRGWSLRSGEPLRNHLTGSTNLLDKFDIEEDIPCIQVSEEADGLRLWASFGGVIISYKLGA